MVNFYTLCMHLFYRLFVIVLYMCLIGSLCFLYRFCVLFIGLLRFLNRFAIVCYCFLLLIGLLRLFIGCACFLFILLIGLLQFVTVVACLLNRFIVFLFIVCLVLNSFVMAYYMFVMCCISVLWLFVIVFILNDVLLLVRYGFAFVISCDSISLLLFFISVCYVCLNRFVMVCLMSCRICLIGQLLFFV